MTLKSRNKLQSKIENIKKDFEKWSILISSHKVADSGEFTIEERKNPAKAERKQKASQKNKKNMKKDYLNCTPVIQVEILTEENSPFLQNTQSSQTWKNIDQEKVIKQSLTKIIQKNIRRLSSDSNNQS